VVWEGAGRPRPLPDPARGTRGAKQVPDEEMPKPPGAAWRAEPATRRGQLDSVAGQMFDKTKSGK
jgi:hypothetical protein